MNMVKGISEQTHLVEPMTASKDIQRDLPIFKYPSFLLLDFHLI